MSYTPIWQTYRKIFARNPSHFYKEFTYYSDCIQNAGVLLLYITKGGNSTLKRKKTILMLVTAAIVLSLTGCSQSAPIVSEAGLYEKYPEAHVLQLNGNTASLDGNALQEFDYSWRADPSLPEAKFDGTVPDEALPAYIAHDIIYYPEIPEASFTREEYDGEQEWVTRYTADGLENYIFGTLPILGDTFPADMMHSAEDAYANPVIHVTEPGEYIIEGSFNGQLFFDFGDEEDTFANSEASVTIILNGADVTCSVAPAIVFHDVYECDNAWESRESYSDITDLSDAGVKIIIADGTENSFTGCNVYRLLKPEYKKDSTTVQKKLWKTDGAFYSFRSLEINAEAEGTGILNITSKTFEGLDSELHMTMNGGYVNVFSQDDGINVNEDHVSVFTLNGGHLTVFAALGAEGDVIDSNGYIRINGGVIAGTSKSPGDELLDSEDGTYLSENATVIAGGSISSDSRFGAPGGTPPDRPVGAPEMMPPDQADGRFREAPPDMPGEKMPEGAEARPDP